MKVQGVTVISNVLLAPLEDKKGNIDNNAPGKDGQWRLAAKERLEERATYRKFTVIHANYACLGTRLFVRLRRGSTGVISLYGATAGAIGAMSGTDKDRKPEDDDDKKIPEYWGIPPDEENTNAAGRPRGIPHKLDDAAAAKDILLNLDGFSYQILNDKDDKQPSERGDWFSFIVCGRPLPEHLKPRYSWLQRQVETANTYEPTVISPYRQLAKVYRDVGDLQRSYYYIRERRWLQLKQNANKLQTVIDFFYSMLFGFGYSPWRAAFTLLILFVVSFGIVSWARYDGAYQDATAARSNETYESHRTWRYENVAARSNVTAKSTCPLATPSPSGQAPILYDIAGEAFRVIFPLTRFQASTACSLAPRHWILRLLNVALQLFSWIIFPLAALTFSGVLREKSDG
jgi:hypothetical protein